MSRGSHAFVVLLRHRTATVPATLRKPAMTHLRAFRQGGFATGVGLSMEAFQGKEEHSTWVVVKVMVPLWVPKILGAVLYSGTNTGP